MPIKLKIENVKYYYIHLCLNVIYTISPLLFSALLMRYIERLTD